MNLILKFFKTHKLIAILILIMSIPLALFPRFNKQDIGIIKQFTGLKQHELNIDMRYYRNMTEYFKGNMPFDSLYKPFAYRPLVPYLASKLPFSSMTSINVVNTIAIVISVFLCFLILSKLGFDFEYKILGGLFFTISFPTVYYGASGFIDSFSIFLIFALIAARIYSKDFLIPFIMIFGAFTKETLVIIFPFLILHLIFENQKSVKISDFLSLSFFKNKAIRNGLILYVLSFILFCIGILIARKTYGSGKEYLWYPNIACLKDNLFRLKTYISFLLSFGIVGYYCIFYIFKNLRNDSRTIYMAFFIGFCLGILLWMYSYVSAYSDGRFIWTCYPFAIPLVLRFLKERKLNFKN